MLDLYVYQDGARLRCGYTTGTCAALAAGAAARMLLTGESLASFGLTTPKGVFVEAELEEVSREAEAVSCAVRKDGGDDIDATDGMLVFARVEKGGEGVTIRGGEGVGRVTKPGLDQPVGEAAINSVPRRMIREEAEAAMAAAGYTGGLIVTIYAPEGTARAGKTFNLYLGVVGGISIIGTTGIVEPRSLEALKKSILVEMRVARSGGAEDLVVTPGNYGAAFIEKYPDLAARPCVKCANFIGDTIDYAVELGFRRLLLVGHIGKFVKLAGGIMNTHSRMADCRQEIMAAYAALCGASRATVARLMDSATTDDCLAILAEAGLKEAVMDRLIGRAQFHAARRAAGALEIGVVIYSNVGGLLRVSPEAEEIIEKIKDKK